MKKEIKRNSKIDATTGEEYIGYPLTQKHKKSVRLNSIGTWLAELFNNHVDRLITLRVYEQRREDG